MIEIIQDMQLRGRRAMEDREGELDNRVVVEVDVVDRVREGGDVRNPANRFNIQVMRRVNFEPIRNEDLLADAEVDILVGGLSGGAKHDVNVVHDWRWRNDHRRNFGDLEQIYLRN
jgi:hypothetical protein